MNHKINLQKLTNKEHLNVLVENRTAYTLERCELNIFETYSPSYQVPLAFNDFVITSMIRGKKIMHLDGDKVFDYLPGETVIVPAAAEMLIDFPQASELNPTQCIALAVDGKQVASTLDYLNEFFPKDDAKDSWRLNFEEQHFYNNAEIAYLTNKIIKICAENSKEKDILVDLSLKELMVRIMQAQNLNVIAHQSTPHHALGFIINFIKENISEKISIARLSEQACMSKASFYRLFKRELGISPNDYILSEKISLAKELLSDRHSKIASISYQLGFNDVNYFIRLFKKLVGITPGAYQAKYLIG